jgi:PhnB protein
VATKPLPYGLHTVTPYLIVKNAQALLDFITKVFDAKQRELIQGPDGKIGHAEVTLGDSVIMLSDKPPHLDAMPGSLYVYVDDTDARYKRALGAGAVSVMEPADQFYGDRNAGVKDPTGNLWWIATHIEDVSPEELARRAKAKMERRDSGAK